MKAKGASKLSIAEKRRLRDAERNFRRIWREIKPFVKKRKVKEYSTRGQWGVAGHEP
jgi:hypothetical protein